MESESLPARVRHFLRRNFLAGLLAILPLVISIWIIRWLIDVLELGVRLLPVHWRPEHVLPFYFPGLGALFTLVVIVVLGMVVSNVIAQRITHYVNGVLLRIPVFRGVYVAVKRLVEAVLMPQHENFRRVILVEYPRKGVYAIGFLTGLTEGEVQEKTKERVMNVFVPTTPNPTSGYYVLIPETDIIPLEMSVEEAFKLVMSGGIVTPQRAAEEKLQAARRLGETLAAER